MSKVDKDENAKVDDAPGLDITQADKGEAFALSALVKAAAVLLPFVVIVISLAGWIWREEIGKILAVGEVVEKLRGELDATVEDLATVKKRLKTLDGRPVSRTDALDPHSHLEVSTLRAELDQLEKDLEVVRGSIPSPQNANCRACIMLEDLKFASLPKVAGNTLQPEVLVFMTMLDSDGHMTFDITRLGKKGLRDSFGYGPRCWLPPGDGHGRFQISFFDSDKHDLDLLSVEVRDEIASSEMEGRPLDFQEVHSRAGGYMVDNAKILYKGTTLLGSYQSSGTDIEFVHGTNLELRIGKVHLEGKVKARTRGCAT